ncbi:hypothetical protein [Fluviicola chungangensis]|uniref:Uncharacterized protein n=1 Tax=Fluviicola chungangensis TaxID=2597671 RepID=A0A556MMP7_9FLAO|nr:hypothetical protein [Fluviicola chungangensis]TSJ41210.1 hypothetical protein FO442_14965 [Fluviicola chungangensis]
MITVLNLKSGILEVESPVPTAHKKIIRPSDPILKGTYSQSKIMDKDLVLKFVMIKSATAFRISMKPTETKANLYQET